jgi:hypothetical protein
MAYRISGKILSVGEPKSLMSKSGTPFVKRDLIIAVRVFDQYTGRPTEDMNNTPKFTFMNDRAQQLDQFKIGDIVEIAFDLTGRPYQKNGVTEYLNDIRPVWIGLARGQQQRPEPTPISDIIPQAMPQMQPSAPEPIAPLQEQNEDLPF